MGICGLVYILSVGALPCPPYTGMYIVDDDGAADDDAVEREIVGGVNFA